MANKDHLIDDESQLGPNWVPVNSAPIVPGQVSAPPVSALMPVVPQFSQGSLPPSFQHDASFVDTAMPTPNAPRHSLMPLGLSGNSVTSAQITSVVKTSQTLVGNTLVLETNGLQNPRQDLLNLEAGSGVALSSDAAGGVTISTIGGGDTRFISRPDYKRPSYWLQAEPVGGSAGPAGITSVGDVVPVRSTTAGFTDSIVGPSATDSPGWKFTGSGAGNYRILWGADAGVFGRDFTFIATANITSGLGNGRYWFAVSDGAIANRFLLVFNNSDDPSPQKTIGFLYSPTSLNWRAVTGNGTTTTNTDTGVVVALNTPVQLRIDWTASTNTAVFTIDGTVVATITTNTPSAATVYGMVQGVHGTSATSVSYASYSMYCAAAYPFSSLILA